MRGSNLKPLRLEDVTGPELEPIEAGPEIVPEAKAKDDSWKVLLGVEATGQFNVPRETFSDAFARTKAALRRPKKRSKTERRRSR